MHSIFYSLVVIKLDKRKYDLNFIVEILKIKKSYDATIITIRDGMHRNVDINTERNTR